MSGKDGEPILVSLRGGYVPSTAPKTELRVTKKANILDKKGVRKQNNSEDMAAVSSFCESTFFSLI